MSEWFSRFSISRQLYSYLANEKRKLKIKKKKKEENHKLKNKMTSNYYTSYDEINDMVDCVIRSNVSEVHWKAIFH